MGRKQKKTWEELRGRDRRRAWGGGKITFKDIRKRVYMSLTRDLKKTRVAGMEGGELHHAKWVWGEIVKSLSIPCWEVFWFLLKPREIITCLGWCVLLCIWKGRHFLWGGENKQKQKTSKTQLALSPEVEQVNSCTSLGKKDDDTLYWGWREGMMVDMVEMD